MSTFLDQTISCGACGQLWTRRVATFIDDSADLTSARESLLHGTFQRFECPACGRHKHVVRPLRWCDRDARLWIALLPDEAETQWPRWERDVPTMAQWDISRGEYGSSDGDRWRLRLVFGLPALTEKLLCAQLGVDDAVLEMLKLNLLDAHPALQREANQRLRLTGAKSGLLQFAGRDARQRWQGVTAPIERLEAVSRSPSLRTLIEDNIAAGPYVDLGRLLVPLPEGGGRDLR